MHQTPRYRTVSETGPDHAKEFTVEATIGGQAFGEGKGNSKQQAAQEAARAALAHFDEQWPSEPEEENGEAEA
jgi:ribonuclease-3